MTRPAARTGGTGQDEGDGAGASSLVERTHELRSLYEAKATAELEIAERLAPAPDVVPPTGVLLPTVAIVKGLPGPAEAAGGAALSGPDGEAVDNALESLGYDTTSVFKMLSRPEPEAAAGRPDRVRYALEAVDPRVVIALDAEAAEDVREALGLDRLPFGRLVRAGGRSILAVDGLEAALTDEKRKRRVWEQMQSIKL